MTAFFESIRLYQIRFDIICNLRNKLRHIRLNLKISFMYLKKSEENTQKNKYHRIEIIIELIYPTKIKGANAISQVLFCFFKSTKYIP